MFTGSRLGDRPRVPVCCSFCDQPTSRENITLSSDDDHLHVCICEMCIVEFALLLARDGREHARFLKEVLPTALRLSKQDDEAM